MKSIYPLSLFILFYCIYLLFTQILFGDNNLIRVKGQLLKKHRFVETDTINQKDINNYAYLTFLLKKDHRFYILKLDINQVKDGTRVLKGVELSLENADEITVWIKKSSLNQIRPKVYKIDADDTVIFELPHKPSNNTRSFALLILLSLSFYIVYYLPKYFATSAVKKRKSPNAIANGL